jgi:hypothetical protein
VCGLNNVVNPAFTKFRSSHDNLHNKKMIKASRTIRTLRVPPGNLGISTSGARDAVLFLFRILCGSR